MSSLPTWTLGLIFLGAAAAIWVAGVLLLLRRPGKSLAWHEPAAVARWAGSTSRHQFFSFCPRCSRGKSCCPTPGVPTSTCRRSLAVPVVYALGVGGLFADTYGS